MAEPLTTDQIFIRKLTDTVLANLNNKNFGVRELANEYRISRSGLNRRLQRLLGKNINQFIREVRLQRALEILKSESVTVSEVAYRVGFSTPEYFNTCFHEFFGYSPGRVNKGDQGGPEIITPITTETVKQEPVRPSRQVFTVRTKLVLIPVALILLIAVIFYPKIFKGAKPDNLRSSDGRISVAVMPFQNLTHDTTWDIWQEGIQTSLISALSGSEELKVRQAETVSSLLQRKGNTDYASITPSVAGMISRKLNANVLIYGNMIKAGAKIRLNVQLFGSKRGEVLKAYELEGSDNEELIFRIVDSLKQRIRDFLIITELNNERLGVDHFTPVPEINPEAYRYCISGDKAYSRLDYPTAIEMYLQAIKIDSNIYNIPLAISKAYYNMDRYKEAKEWCLKYYKKLDLMNMEDKIAANFWYTFLFKTPNESIIYLKQLIDIDDKNPGYYYRLGDKYLIIGQYDKAINAFEKSLDIYREWNVKPGWIGSYSELGEAYHKTGNFKKEKRLYRKAEKDFPDDLLLRNQQAVLALTVGDSVAANQYIRKCISGWEEQAWSEARIAANLAMIYSEAGVPDLAERYFRKALTLEPESPARFYYLARFIINNDRSINEALDLIDKALQTDPDNYKYLHTKGWGLYKQGKNEEALAFFEKADSLKPVYDHLLYLHLQEVKKAVADKN